MSDYEFRCPECKKVNCIHSSGESPRDFDSVECISCGRISIIQERFETLLVAMTPQKKYPSKLDAISKSQEKTRE